MNHRKTDRLLELADRERLPVVMFAEGGGGRPGDTDTTSVAGLDVPTFRLTAGLSGRVPLVAVVSGYCFAGNAALAGVCDVIIATPEASLGMGGPAMIEGGGLGVVAPDAVGPMSIQVPNGVVDLLVADEAAAVAAARRYLSYFGGSRADIAAEHGDQRRLRHLIPENRVRGYDVRPVLEALCDTGSVLELRAGFGAGVLTALARLGGHPVGLLANNPRHLGGAIDGEAADKATAFLRLCEAHRLPIVSLVDTPGFMVGPAAERTATMRRFGAMFVAGARLTVPVCAVVLRKAFGLGAMAMTAGDLRRPAITVAWPTGEFGGMGLEGAVRLGYRKELEAIGDAGARQARYEELVAEQYARGQALSAAMAFEIERRHRPGGHSRRADRRAHPDSFGLKFLLPAERRGGADLSRSPGGDRRAGGGRWGTAGVGWVRWRGRGPGVRGAGACRKRSWGARRGTRSGAGTCRRPLRGRGRVTGAQRLGVIPALVGQHGPLVAAQLGVFFLELLPGAPLLAQLAEVLGVPLVGASPGLRHLLHRRAGIGAAAQRYPRRDLLAGPAARRAALPGAVGDRGHLLEHVPLRTAVVVQRHRPSKAHQFSIDLAKIPAISSSATGRGQVASRRCCFIVPGTRSGMSASV